MTGRPLSLLDNIRISSGPEILRSYFSELLHTNRNNLAELLSDRHLRFSTLYMLKSDIKGSGLRDSLPAVYKQALELSEALSEAETADTAPSRRRSSTFGRYAGTRLSGRNRAGKKRSPSTRCLPIRPPHRHLDGSSGPDGTVTCRKSITNALWNAVRRCCWYS